MTNTSSGKTVGKHAAERQGRFRSEEHERTGSSVSVDFVVRSYRPTDREAVRHICCETGHLGDPIDAYFGDREVFADLVTSYYTDREPEWIFVAEIKGKVVGYLTGCPDTRRYLREFPRLLGRVGAKALARGILLRKSTAPRVARLLSDAALERPRLGWYGDAMPAHFHVDLLPEARGAGIGRCLLDRYFEALKEHGVPGVFCETSCENQRAVAFFRAMGMEPLHSAPSPGARSADGSRIHVLAMGKRLD